MVDRSQFYLGSGLSRKRANFFTWRILSQNKFWPIDSFWVGGFFIYFWSNYRTQSCYPSCTIKMTQILMCTFRSQHLVFWQLLVVAVKEKHFCGFAKHAKQFIVLEPVLTTTMLQVRFLVLCFLANPSFQPTLVKTSPWSIIRCHFCWLLKSYMIGLWVLLVSYHSFSLFNAIPFFGFVDRSNYQFMQWHLKLSK